MPYTALYRRLRPKSFKDMIGQQHITKTLVNQIVSGRISHAYLFCGTRGTGKTSTARLFARAVNCLNLKDGEPCGVCEACMEIYGQRSLDVVEIDAASNNSVDNVRDLREEVKYPPAFGKYRVYIIDEVHMLSTGAFNALLKTLEEPPAHVVFILATTDPQKIPATILSRCQRFDFRRVTARDIFTAVRGYIAGYDLDIRIEDDALMYIASLSDGSMRDALSILEQCAAFYHASVITLENVQETVGSVDKSVFFELTDALTSYNTNKCLEIISELVYKGRDISQFTGELLVHFRNLLVAGDIGAGSLALDLSFENTDRLAAQASGIGRDVLICLIGSFSIIQNQLRYASNERIILEIACIKFCNPIDDSDDPSGAPSAAAYVKALEKKIDSLARLLEETRKSGAAGVVNTAAVNSPAPDIIKTPIETTRDNPFVSSKQSTAQQPEPLPEKKAEPQSTGGEAELAVKNWNKFVAGFDIPLRNFLMKTKPENGGGLRLRLVTDAGCRTILKSHEQKIKERLKNEFGHDYFIELTDKENISEQPPARKFDSADFTEKINMDIMFDS